MKTKLAILLVGIALAPQWAQANDNVGKDHPCHVIKSACEAAGFKKGGHKEGKGLWKDCVEPLKEGKTVAGVSVTPDQVAACKAKRDAKKSK